MKLNMLDKMLDELADKYPALEDQAMELKSSIADLEPAEDEEDMPAEEDSMDMMEDEEEEDMFAELPEDEDEDLMA